ncbi:MAG: prolipoprotein diacylglyceryl transferase family protein [Myxococcota bacterium]
MNLVGVLPYWTFGPWNLFGPITIYSFGLMVALGLLVGFSYMSWRAEKKYGVSGEDFQNYGIFLIVVAWPLSHVFNVIFYEPQLLAENPLELFKFWGSISSYGGLFGGFIAFAIWRYRNKDKNHLDWAEMSVVALVLPWLFGRMGCFSVHDHPGALVYDFWLWEQVLEPVFGGPDLWPLAVDFPARYNLPAGPRHDLGFYEAIWWGLIFLIVLFLDRKPRKRGFFLAVIPMLYAPGRFMFDSLRVSQEMGGDIRYYGLTPAQYFSIGIFCIGLFMAFYIRNNEVREWVQYDRAADPKSPESRERAKGEKNSGEKSKKKTS